MKMESNCRGLPVKRVPLSMGHTLIEVLVALALLSTSLSGLAAMNILSIRNNHDSYLRSQAIHQARNIAARMYANPAGLKAGYYDSINDKPDASPRCIDRKSTRLAEISNGPCDASEIAQFDINEWMSDLASLLPDGKGQVQRKTGDQSLSHCHTEGDSFDTFLHEVFIISVSWRDPGSKNAANQWTTTSCLKLELKPVP